MKTAACLFLLLLTLILLSVQASEEEKVVLRITPQHRECVERIAVFSQTRDTPVRLFWNGASWTTEPLRKGEYIQVSYEPDQTNCRDHGMINEQTLDRYGSKAVIRVTYNASLTITSKPVEKIYITITPSKPECLLDISSNTAVTRRDNLYIVGPLTPGQQVRISPVIARECEFESWTGYTTRNLSLSPRQNITLTLYLKQASTSEAPVPSHQVTQPMNIQQLYPAVVAVTALASVYAAAKILKTLKHNAEEQRNRRNRMSLAKTMIANVSKNQLLRRGWLWRDVDPVKALVEKQDKESRITAYLMLAGVIPVSRNLRKKLEEQTLALFNEAASTTVSGYIPPSTLENIGRQIIQLSVQLAAEDAENLEKIKTKLKKHGVDPSVLPKEFAALDMVVYEARGLSIFDLGIRVEEEIIQEKENGLIKCVHCGAKTLASGQFCVKCGNLVHKIPAADVEQYPSQETQTPPKAISDATKTKTPPQPHEPPPESRHPPRPEPVAEKAETITVKEWRPPQWIVNRAAELGVTAEMIGKAVESVSAVADIRKAALKAASTIADELGIMESEKPVLILNLSTLLESAITDSRTANTPIKTEPRHQPVKQASAEKIRFSILVKQGPEPGKIYVLPEKHVGAAALPSSIIASLLPDTVEKYAVEYEDPAVLQLGKPSEKPVCLILTMGLSRHAIQHRTVKPSPSYTPVKKIAAFLSSLDPAHATRVSIITHPHIHALIADKAAKFIKVDVEMDEDVAETEKQLRQTYPLFTRLSVAETLMPGITSAIQRGELGNYLKKIVPDPFIADMVARAVTFQPDVPKPVLIAFGLNGHDR